MPVDNLSTCMQTIGQYDLVEKIAEGGMGTVYRGRNRLTGEIVAVKVVPQHLLSNPVVLKRFEQEYLVARAIDHPNIVKALDFGRDGETRYLVMELIEGESLGQKIERDGKMSEEEAIRIITQVALGLQKAHKQGLIHRDVKPDNILLTTDGQVKLTDLGLVKEIEADLNLTRTGRGLGTPHFMAPEQFRNAKKADVRCDIYSLGATLYMMVTGDLPFKSNGPLDAWMKKINNEIEPPRQLIPDLSERIDWAIRRSISPDPIHRPENCREFIEDLTGHCTKPLSGTEAGLEKPMDQWYITYTDEEAVVHTVRATLKGIRRSFRDGLIGDAENVRVARSHAGPFEPLRQFPEFRDLVVQPGKLPTAKEPGSDAKAKNLTAAVAAAPTPKASDSVILSNSKAMAAMKQSTAPTAAPTGPCINLRATGASSAEAWKWIILGLIFAGGGVFATFYLPTIIRYIRFYGT
jgi:eukaryotic-like serine/threonine-protein kinase